MFCVQTTAKKTLPPSFVMELPTCFWKKSQTLSQKSQKRPGGSYKEYTHKTCITKHNINVITRQKHRYNTIPILKRIYLLLNLYRKHQWFLGQRKTFARFCAPCMFIDSYQKRFVMNLQLRQCFTRAKAFRMKKAKSVQKKPEFQNLASKKITWFVASWISQGTFGIEIKQITWSNIFQKWISKSNP